jgi:glycyl-tRNA synthetase beta chain
MARDFLLEIGSEELPSSACAAVLELLPDRVAGLFAGAEIEIDRDSLVVLVSPRRIAVSILGVPETQTPRENVQRGPSYEAAFDPEGIATKAAAGFARAMGVTPEELQVREENGRRFVYFVSRSEARPTAELLPEICLKIVRDMYFPKNMRWGYKDLRFSRPMRWLVALYGDEVVPFAIAGVTSGNASRGHRSLGGPVAIARPAEYVETVRSVAVVVDQRERERFLWSELRRLAAGRDLQVIDPMGKMSEVLYLVEWPTVLEGAFHERHLRLPQEVLIIAMQSHQRYFPLVDGDGNLASTFLYVMNGDPRYAAEITAGNERVLEGRIEDAEFSFDKDVATGIEEMVLGLDRVVFHEKLGSMKDKTERLVGLTGYLAEVTAVSAEARSRALEAARLAKADQVSIMVREFPDLEGVMGQTYARMEGIHEEITQAIREQFLPDAAGGRLPETVPGALLATAEKADSIVAAFACAEPPTGSKDPYGLRRAAMGMVTIAFAHGFDYDVRELVETAYDRFAHRSHLVAKAEVVPAAVDFVLERLVKALADDGFARDSIEAVLPTSAVFRDLRARVEALESFRATPPWEDLVVVFTRPFNLAKKLPPEAAGAPMDPALFQLEAEGALFSAWGEDARRVAELVGGRDYGAAMSALAGLRPALDRYFDDVLVMAEEEAVRLNRLRLLAGIAGTVRTVAHLERIQG